MKRKKTQKEYIDRGCGFPVRLLNVPMILVRGAWTPRIDYNKLAREVMKALARKPTRLTGNEIRFIRLQSGMTLVAFGRRFGVTHANVKKWESHGDEPTNMQWSTEKDIRLFVALATIGAQAIAPLYRELTPKAPQQKSMQVFDVDIFALAA